MKIHIAGIGGTFMAGLARIAVELGHSVEGSDAGVYPPMSDQLSELGIKVHQGYRADAITDDIDMVVIGNALSRGNALVEYVLSQQIPYTSGPEWLKNSVLQHRHVIAVSGTHGKTTVTSLIAWLLDQAGTDPGFLIGGVAENFGVSARLGDGQYFVIEADEYDTAFFDKRSKFIHYLPRTLVINNLEFDHADIFDNLGDIARQFHHLIRTLPQEAVIFYPHDDQNIQALFNEGLWSVTKSFGDRAGADIEISERNDTTRELTLTLNADGSFKFPLPLFGAHNALNTAAAIGVAIE